MAGKRKHQAFFQDAVDELDAVDGVSFADLDADDIVDITTRNHRYTFRAIDPEAGTFEAMSDGPSVPDPVAVTVTGSVFGRTSIKRHWFGMDCKVEFVLPDGRIVKLSRTQAIAVNGVRVAPREPGALN